MFQKMFNAALRALLLLAAGITPAFARADEWVRFINLSNRDAFVAKYTYHPYSASSSAGAYSLPAESPEGWRFEGWWKVEPGGTYLAGKSGHYYVQQDGQPVIWNNLPMSPGFVTGDAFSEFVARSEWNGRKSQLIARGFREVSFQKFAEGNYRISGNAYRIEERSFSFDFSSLNRREHNQTFSVPGQVAYVSVSSESRGATPLARIIQGQSVTLRVTTEGAAPYPTAARAKGYSRGSLRVFYTVPQ